MCRAHDSLIPCYKFLKDKTQKLEQTDGYLGLSSTSIFLLSLVVKSHVS